MYELLQKIAEAGGLFDAKPGAAAPPERPPVRPAPPVAQAGPAAGGVFDHYADGAEHAALRDLAVHAKPDEVPVIRELAMELDWKRPEGSHGAMHELIGEARASGGGIDDAERGGLVELLGDLHREARTTTQEGQVIPDSKGRPGFRGRIDTAEEAGLSGLRRDLGTEHMGFVESMAARGHDPEYTRTLVRDIETYHWDGDDFSGRESADYIDMLGGRFDDHKARGGDPELRLSGGTRDALFREAETLAWPCQRPAPGRRPAAIPELLALHFDRDTSEVSMPNIAVEPGGGLGFTDAQSQPELSTRPRTTPRKAPGPILRDPVTGVFDEAFLAALDKP